MLTRIICWTILCSIFTYTAHTQQLPKQTEAIITINREYFKTQNFLERLEQYTFFQKFETDWQTKSGKKFPLLQQIYQKPAQAGIDTLQPLFLFLDQVDEYAHSGIQFPIQNVTVFEEHIRQLAQREALPPPNIPGNIDPKIRTLLLQQHKAREALNKQVSIQPIPNSTSKFLELPKATLVWNSKYGYIYRTNEVDPRAKLKDIDQYDTQLIQQIYRQSKQQLKAIHLAYAKTLSIATSRLLISTKKDDVLHLWMNSDASSLLKTLPKPTKSSPQPNLLKLLTGELLQLVEGREQSVSLQIKQHQLLFQHQYTTEKPLRLDATKPLQRSDLRTNQLLSIQQTPSKGFVNWATQLYGDPQLSDLKIIEKTRFIHGFQEGKKAHIITTNGKVDTNYIAVLLPVYTSLFEPSAAPQLQILLDSLIAKNYISTTKEPNIYQLKEDKGYQLNILSDDNGIWWTTFGQEIPPSLSILAAQAPLHYQYTDATSTLAALHKLSPIPESSTLNILHTNWESLQAQRKTAGVLTQRRVELNLNDKQEALDVLLQLMDTFIATILATDFSQ